MKIELILIILLSATALSACGAPAATPVPPTSAPATTPASTPTTAPANAPVAPVVNTQSGPVQGVAANNTLTFKGIPYAAPPVGELRWRLPQPAIPWTDVRPADQFGPVCPQSSPNADVAASVPQSEDCLTLNVWTPDANPNAKHPVMVWIHGGGLIGAGSAPTYNGQFLAARGAVVVTLNYRLGFLGVFAHPALEAETPNGPVNFGWYDQMAALQWVQQNISAFGGDPGNVTIFGESYGGECVVALFASPLARGLFQRGIVESSPVALGKTRAQANTEGANFATSVGLPGAQATAAQLRAIPVERFPKVVGVMPEYVVGDPYLPQSIFTTFQQGTEAPVPLIIGSNSAESTALTGLNFPAATVPKKVEALGIPVRELYPEAASDQELGSYVLTDALYTAPARLIAELHAQRAPTWQYYFSYVPVKQRSVLSGMPHGFEIMFVFGTYELLVPKGMFTPADVDMSRRVIDYWYTFAHTGKPEPADEPAWPATDGRNNQTMVFGETIAAQPDFKTEQLNAYTGMLKNNRDFWAVVDAPLGVTIVTP